jgi:hypothetical protein
VIVVETAPSLGHPPHRSFRLSRSADAPPLTNRALLTAWAAYVLLSAIDCLTTVYGLGHNLHENNPVAAHLYAGGGAAALWAFKFAVLGVMMPLLARLPRRLALMVALVLVAVMYVNDVSNLAWILRTG